MSQAAKKSATLYRMMMPTHTCPYGLKAMDLLSRHGYQVDDRHLSTKEMTDAFKAEHDVRTTPQIWLGDEHVGGFDALKVRLGYKVKDPNKKNLSTGDRYFRCCSTHGRCSDLADEYNTADRKNR